MLRRIALVGILAAAFPLSALATRPPLTPATIPAARIALEIPATWQAGKVPPSYKTRGVEALFFSPTRAQSFTANINLIVAPAPPGQSLRAWLLGSYAVKSLALGKLDSLTVNGVASLRYKSSKLEHAAGRALFTEEFAFLHGGKGYLFTYTALATDRGKYEPSFDASGITIKFTG